MSNISQFFKGTGRGGLNPGRNNRRIYADPGPYTFTAPPATTEVEINCWGGGGSAWGSGGGGGGGGGYARFVWTGLTGGESFALTVGGGGSGPAGAPGNGAPGGTTSAECSSQTPGSPIQATGGSGAFAWSSNNGGSGGVGSGTVPAPESHHLIVADGGDGGAATAPTSSPYGGGGGGAAGSFYGPGGNGAPGGTPQTYGGGGGSTFVSSRSQKGASGHFFGNDTEGWYFVEELIAGDGGIGGSNADSTGSGDGEFLAGGGGAHTHPGQSFPDDVRFGGSGGFGGGEGGTRSVHANGSGGPGIIIVYYN